MATAKKQTVTFLEDVTVLDHNGEIEQSFKKGEAASLAPASARRWISRGKATEGKVQKEPPAKAAAATDQDDEAQQPGK